MVKSYINLAEEVGNKMIMNPTIKVQCTYQILNFSGKHRR